MKIMEILGVKLIQQVDERNARYLKRASGNDDRQSGYRERANLVHDVQPKMNRFSKLKASFDSDWEYEWGDVDICELGTGFPDELPVGEWSKLMRLGRDAVGCSLGALFYFDPEP